MNTTASSADSPTPSEWQLSAPKPTGSWHWAVFGLTLKLWDQIVRETVQQCAGTRTENPDSRPLTGLSFIIAGASGA